MSKGIKGSTPTCSIESCTNNSHGHGWCLKHYKRWLRQGSASYEPPIYGPICEVEGCDLPRYERGWCTTHYSRWRRFGNPLYDVRPQATFGEPLKFLKDCLATRDRSTCWEWPYGCVNGYGMVHFEGTDTKAGVVGMILEGRPRPEPPNHLSLHSCDNPSCFNPTHLRWGSNADNSLDKVARNRQAKGTQLPQTKLTEDQVRAIRRDTRTHRAIASEYGVTSSVITVLKQGKTWKHVH